MPTLFAIAAIIAVAATLLAITRSDVMHALLYLILSLLAVALALYALGAPYLAALEVIIYAGAIMVLFVFVTMMLNLGKAARRQERQWQPGRGWIAPAVLAGGLLATLVAVLLRAPPPAAVRAISPQAVGLRLLGPYLIGVELASMLLLAGLVAAYHLGYGLQRRQAERSAGAAADGAQQAGKP